MAQTVQEAATPAGSAAANGNVTTPSTKAAVTPASPNSDKASLLTLPLARVKRMIKEEDDVAPASNEADFLIARATELFIEGLSSRTAAQMTDADKCVAYSHVAQAVGGWSPCDFLQGVPRLMVSTYTCCTLFFRNRRGAEKDDSIGAGGRHECTQPGTVMSCYT